MKVEATEVDGRKVFSVRAFNQGIASWLQRLPTRLGRGRGDRAAPAGALGVGLLHAEGSRETAPCLAVQMPRGQFDGLRLDLVDGERVHVYGRPELYEQRGDFHLRALTIERYGLGAHLAALERLKQKLAAEGLFAAERKRPLPRIPRLVGLVTGNDAAAKRDVLTAITTRFPPAHVARRRDVRPGRRAPRRRSRPRSASCASAAPTCVVLARGGGSFEDLLPFSDERLVRAVAACPVPVVSAVGHEQDTPLVDLAADVRASTPSVAGRLVVPDLAELNAWLDRAHAGLERGARRVVERQSRAPRRRARAPRAARRCSRSSAAAPGSTTRTAACSRSRRARRSSAATRSSAPASSSSASRRRPGPSSRSRSPAARSGRAPNERPCPCGAGARGVGCKQPGRKGLGPAPSCGASWLSVVRFRIERVYSVLPNGTGLRPITRASTASGRGRRRSWVVRVVRACRIQTASFSCRRVARGPGG